MSDRSSVRTIGAQSYEGEVRMRGKPSLMVIAALLTAVASASAVSAARSSPSRTLAGGTYRVGWELDKGHFSLLGGFDPTVELNWGTSGIYRNLLVRTLVGYDHAGGAAGARLVPDLAVSVPTPSNGGRTFTFRLKRGIRFGPPVDREITSADIRYAIERTARPTNRSVYAAAFADLRGFGAYRAGRATSIAGIATPDARTIRFDLVRPALDFPYRLTLPAAGPIPPEVGRCFEGTPGAYGSDLVSSGPYMIEGADAVRIGSCAAIRPMRGISPTQIALVRNPRYSRATDSSAARESNPDRFLFVADVQSGVLTHYAPAMVGRLNAGELEDAFLPSLWPLIIKRYSASAERRGRLRRESWGETLYIAMNLTQPPFDDVHVRRAMNWIVDRAALRDAYGGPMAGPIAQHVLPDELLDGVLEGYRPFATRGDHGSLARAKAEMRKSRYATMNGVCVAKACRSIRMGTAGPYAPSQRVAEIVRKNARRIGVLLINRSRPRDRPSSNNQIVVNAQWVQPWPDPSGFMVPLLSGSFIQPSGNVNYSLVGLTAAQARRLGVGGRIAHVPSVDADIGRCNARAGASRTACWARLDRKVTAEIAPWIPFLWRDSITILGPHVAKWAYDRSAGTTAFAHVALRR
jgi:peptide/nickel transport system substrate-binding protein